MIYDLTWRQWCGVVALAILAAVIVGRAAWVLMGRHEQPHDSVLRRAAARICQAIWPAEDEYGEVTDDNGEPIGDLLPDVPGHGTGDPSPLPAVPGHHHEWPPEPTDTETEAQWQADHDELAEDSPGPASDARPVTQETTHDAVAGPGVIIQAAIVQGETVILDGQPSPPRSWQPDDTLIDLRPEPRASHALWRQAAPRRADWYVQLMALRPAWYVAGGAA